MNFIKYIFIGIFNTLLGYSLIFYFMYIEITPELSNFIGYVIVISISYYLNKKYNFKSKINYKKEMPKFFISMGIAYIINLIVLYITYRIFSFNAYLSQVLAGVSYTISGYLLSKLVVFKNKE